MRQQHGSALIISLLILLVMTIIGISAMSSSTLEEKMAASDRTQKAIFQNGENSLHNAEADLLNADYFGPNGVKDSTYKNQKGYYAKDDIRFPYHTPSEWDPASKCIEIPNNSNVNGRSCYVIEEVVSPEDDWTQNGVDMTPDPQTPKNVKLIAKITVRSTDNQGTSAVILQTNVQKNIN